MFWHTSKLQPKDLPHAVERCLSAPTETVFDVKQLWLETICAVRPLALRSIFASILMAGCAIGSTLIGMMILRDGQTPLHLALLAVTYFFFNLLGQVGVFLNSRFRIWGLHATQARLVTLLSEKLLRISSRAAAQQSSGNLKVLITSDVQNIAEFVDNWFRNLIPAGIGLALVGPLLVHLSGVAGFVALLIMIAFLPISAALNQISEYFQTHGQDALDSLASLLGEWVKNVRLIRYLSWDEPFEKSVAAKLRRYMSFSTAQHLMACLIFGFSVCWWMVAVLGVFVVARWTQTPLDISGFFGSLWLITFLASYFTHLPYTIKLWGMAAPSMRRLAAVQSEEEQKDLLTPSAKNESCTGTPVRVRFESVTFVYPGENEPVIRDLSVVIELHRKTAIIGEVASGKSTFLKLLCGEFPPTQGRIWIEFDDQTRHNLWTTACYETYRDRIGWVPQGPFVSCDPLSMNISLMGDAEESSVLAAAYWAELEADIQAFPNGIHEEVGESGINLSGGQKQRLNLARAYYSARNFLIMDDSLSAVDHQTEVALMKRLETTNRGFVLVTHRTAEIMRVEEVLVMKQGQILERGTPSDLAADPSTLFSSVLRAYSEHEALV